MTPRWNQKQDRTSILAQPKVNHQLLFCRPTVYWVDKIPKEQPRFTVPVLTSRQEELSQIKKVNADFRGDRPTPMWPVSRAALKVEASPRLRELAQPRHYADVWELSRPRSLMVSKGALTATATPRIIALAEPKHVASPSREIRRKSIHGPIVGVEKFNELSKPRVYAFEAPRPPRISRAALEYVPSPRILEISRPMRVRGKVSHMM
ncbi:testicular haploid expressed gene protein [Sceloporus undulatus]|uniref:testicular haploid expressed gene protein n=1 Tax=Sceloporus undulatus TaxID=8520 RepID=UPI001C4D7ABC|nr:testicular haploid expressed gene protein [Sceloporus undulatus]